MDELRTAWLKLKSFVDDQARERQHYLAFFEHAADAWFVTDARGRIVEANGAAVDLLDRRRKYLTGKPLVVFVAPEARGEFRRCSGLPAARWQSCIQSRGRRTHVEFSARAMPGRGVCWRVRPVQ